jgi:hypothetical protein
MASTRASVSNADKDCWDATKAGAGLRSARVPRRQPEQRNDQRQHHDDLEKREGLAPRPISS